MTFKEKYWWDKLLCLLVVDCRKFIAHFRCFNLLRLLLPRSVTRAAPDVHVNTTSETQQLSINCDSAAVE